MPEKKASKPKPVQKRGKKDPHEASTPSDSPMEDPPRREPGKRATTRAGREKLPTCGAENRQGNPCKKPAGAGTSHPGEGRCRLHGGVGQLPSTRYAHAQVRPRLGELIDRFAADENPHDLSHELTLLRALVFDYIERYDAVTEALLAWHASFNGDFEMEMRRWRADVAAYLEEAENDHAEPKRPFPTPPYPSENKPRQVVDIVVAAGYIDKIGSMSERIEKRKNEGHISMSVLDDVLEQLAVELVYACQEVGIDDSIRPRLLASVDRRWRTVRTDPRASAESRVADRARALN